ncbi:hypothetical protein P3521_07630 [Vibrio parahaemolyticus]|nr:hypothetical protein [Vibrio parahaemolyticus]MDF4669472.1 hypothetical protein [Vibrio parahaemolyticus]HAV1413636.1 hypothetical protein [Vibrio parahaemolyticus]HAV2004334.1 hypothetical protein [Vibrio parahaemolyticus]
MFAELLKILGFVKDAASDINQFKSLRERESAIVELLKTYFYLYDVHRDGVKLLDSIGPDPIGFVNSASEGEIRAIVDVWDSNLRLQGLRLYSIQEFISSKSYLAVINPKAVDEIGKVIRYKMDRVVSLHQIGAALFFRNVFPIETSPQGLASLVVMVLTKHESGLVDKEKVAKELVDLEEALYLFKNIVDDLTDKAEILKLSDKARKETLVGKQA